MVDHGTGRHAWWRFAPKPVTAGGYDGLEHLWADVGDRLHSVVPVVDDLDLPWCTYPGPAWHGDLVRYIVVLPAARRRVFYSGHVRGRSGTRDTWRIVSGPFIWHRVLGRLQVLASWNGPVINDGFRNGRSGCGRVVPGTVQRAVGMLRCGLCDGSRCWPSEHGLLTPWCLAI